MATADILQRYGIKEVADVTFYHINKATNVPDYPILILDSLKVTSIEQTAETAEARGGKGNSKLIVWDFGKEITVNIEDALFSPKSLSVMFSDGTVNEEQSDDSEYGVIRKSARVVATEDGKKPIVKIDGRKVDFNEISDESWFKDGKTGAFTDFSEVKKGQVLYVTWKHPVHSKSVITITPDSFPGTYYVTGDTMVRSERNGEDEYFQFVIPKAKMQAEQTITMEAEGDPSTFNMSLQILRPEDGEMLKFIKYEFADDEDTDLTTSGTQDRPAIGGASDGWYTETTETTESSGSSKL